MTTPTRLKHKKESLRGLASFKFAHLTGVIGRTSSNGTLTGRPNLHYAEVVTVDRI